ncbi:hypothetical protein V1477_006143, partial [Vespula maculifrons]
FEDRIRDERTSLYLYEGHSGNIPIEFARYTFPQFVQIWELAGVVESSEGRHGNHHCPATDSGAQSNGTFPCHFKRLKFLILEAFIVVEISNSTPSSKGNSNENRAKNTKTVSY